jgi:hypothetical protein
VRKRAIMLLAMERGIYCLYLDLERAGPDVPGRWLREDEPIPIGPYTLIAGLASGASLADPGFNPQKARSAPPIPVLHISTGGLLKDRRRVRHPLTMIGRRPQCSLRLMGEIVSSHHTLLYWCAERLWCLDLISSNGTRMGDELIACRELALGEQIEVGEFSLLYYRWSPRRLTPGMQADEPPDALIDEQPLEAAMASSLAAAAALEQDDEPAADLLAAKEGELRAQEERFLQQMAAHQAEIERQRQELQQQSEQTATQFSEKLRALEADAERIAAERDALVRSRTQWEQDRLALTRQMTDRDKELARLEAELAAAREVLASRESRAADAAPQEAAAQPVPDESTVPAPHWRLADMLPAPKPIGEPAASLPISAPIVALSTTVVEPAASVAVESRPTAPLPVGRRKAEEKEELTSFVSGRLGDIEDSRRRQMLILWAAVAATVLVTATTGLGLWFWFG